MNIYFCGEPVLIEQTIKRQAPFAASNYFDPSSAPLITVTDPNGTVKVAAAAMTQSGAGRFYYVVQTLSAWAAGNYIITITWSAGTLSGVVRKTLFKLV